MPGDNVDMMIPIVALISVLVTRVLQTFREAGRLAASGFTPDDVHRGLEAAVAERDVRRAELHADATTRRARRRTLIAAVAQLLGAVVMFRWALTFRHFVRPGWYQVETPGIVLIFSAAILFGVSLALLLRSPFRMPIGERLFRLLWLGPLGRAFVRMAGRGHASRAGGGPVAVVTVAPAAVTSNGAHQAKATVTVAVAAERVAKLESRIAELERWRERAESR
jgi:hypothetical protein